MKTALLTKYEADTYRQIFWTLEILHGKAPCEEYVYLKNIFLQVGQAREVHSERNIRDVDSGADPEDGVSGT